MPVPTHKAVADEIISLVKKHEQNADMIKIAELGAGWGGLMRSLAQAFPNAHITGYELSPFAYVFSKLRFLLKTSAELYFKDFFKADLGGYDIIVFYLTPKLTKQLQEKFENDLKPNTLIISNAFPLPDWTPIEIVDVKAIVKTPIYVYRKSHVTL